MLNNISDVTRLLCGIILITVPTIEFGGAFLLKMLRTREPGYLDNPIRQNLFRAGHAHAGVIVILSLVCQVLVDSIILPGPIAWVVRIGVPASAILIPAGVSFCPWRHRDPSTRMVRSGWSTWVPSFWHSPY